VKDRVRADWTAAVLVCRKCSRKLDGGFGADGDRPLAKLLRGAIGGGKGRKATVGVVEVGCLGICPKRGVVVVDSARPGEWLLVEAGTELSRVVERLGVSAV
jgi:predicted metal-binding protein